MRAPGLRRPFAPSRPLHPTGCCSPHSAIVPPPKTVDVHSLVDRPAQPRTCTIPRRSGIVHPPDAQARDRAVAPRSPRGAGQQPAGLPKGQRRPPYRAHWPVSGRSSRYRASLCPAEPGRRNAPQCSEERSSVDPLFSAPIHQIHLPVECTGRANSTSVEPRKDPPHDRSSTLAPLVETLPAPHVQPTCKPARAVPRT